MPMLGPGEAMVQSESAESESGRGGMLYLTSQRIIFEGAKHDGIIKQAVRGVRMATLLDVQLAHISNVHSDKPLIGRATLRVEAGGKAHIFKVRDADQWVGAVSRTRQTAPAPSPYGLAAHQPVIVNVHQAAAAPAAPPQVYLHCRYCGTLGTPGGKHCANCGAAL